MSTISLRASVPANAASGNVLAGSPFEFVAANSVVSLAIVQAGGTPGEVNADYQVGGESIVSQGNISTRNAFPTFRDDVIAQSGAEAGERLFLNLNNTTAGALNVDVLVDVRPI